jgi:DNA modification methylase
MFREDIETEWYRMHWVDQPNPSCFNKSSTSIDELESESVGICITSPPYLNNFDYAEMTRMHLYLLGWAGSWKEISTSVRNDLITNTTTALNGKKGKENQQEKRASLPSKLLKELDEIVSYLVVERKSRAGKKEYDYLVYPYYSEIKQVLSGVHRVLKTGGEVHWVVADAALYGIHIKTHLHTAEIMREIGFKNVAVEFIRKRGHRWILDKRDGAKEGLGEYHIKATKGK